MRHPLLTGLLAVLVTLGALAASTATAHADPRVDYTSESGPALDPDSPTPVAVSGSGFQSIKGGFGGIYVFFGTVSDGWKPSQGGVTGEDYLYVPDSESKNNKGYQRFVAFPGSETQYAANGGTVAADGTWSSDMVVPGAQFEARDRDGNARQVNCLEVTCGFITIGAHGVSNASNESFTPVEFAESDGSDEGTDGEGDQGADDGDGQNDEAAPPVDDNDSNEQDGSSDGVPEPRGKPVVSVDPATAVEGRILSFTGYGFRPGEQIVVTLDDGIASVGPLTAGESGEIAGVMELPPQVEAGTHTIRMTGAASRAKPTKNFAVRVDPNAVAAQEVDESQASETPVWRSTPFRFLVAAACVLVIVVAGCTTWLLVGRRRRPPKSQPVSARPAEAGGDR